MTDTMITNLVPVEYSSVRVLTTEQLAQLYECETNAIKQNFNANKDRFIIGTHYFCVEGEALKSLKDRVRNSNLVGKNARTVYLWTKRGASRHSKMLGTDRAWEMFDLLEENYFNPKLQAKVLSPMEQLDLHYQVLKDHDNRLKQVEQKFDSFSKDQQQTNAAIEETLQKQQQQLTRIATRAATIPDEYPPVNIEERNRMSRKAGALCKFVSEATGRSIGEIQNDLKGQIILIFENQFQINLYAVLEEAKKWYTHHYLSLKAEDPKNVPHNVLRPKDIKSLSLYAAISLNKTWIDFYNQIIDNAFETYREEVESDV